ncbi:MAG: LysR family transcriptional regulator [Trichococcus flocculiformis]|jgi:DNA-binding transcriptional LysR family regulator
MIDYHYQTFLVLADTLDYAKTAQELCLSKPTITQHIQYLEADLEVKLFQNQGGNLTLTKKGQLLKNRLIVINDHIEDLLRSLATG